MGLPSRPFDIERGKIAQSDADKWMRGAHDVVLQEERFSATWRMGKRSSCWRSRSGGEGTGVEWLAREAGPRQPHRFCFFGSEIDRKDRPSRAKRADARFTATTQKCKNSICGDHRSARFHLGSSQTAEGGEQLQPLMSRDAHHENRKPQASKRHTAAWPAQDPGLSAALAPLRALGQSDGGTFAVASAVAGARPENSAWVWNGQEERRSCFVRRGGWPETACLLGARRKPHIVSHAEFLACAGLCGRPDGWRALCRDGTSEPRCRC